MTDSIEKDQPSITDSKKIQTNLNHMTWYLVLMLLYERIPTQSRLVRCDFIAFHNFVRLKKVTK